MTKHVTRIVPATPIDLSDDPETGGATLVLRLENGHDWSVVLDQVALLRLSQLLHEHAEQRSKVPPQTEKK